MLWSKILQNKHAPIAFGLMAVTCIFPPWQNGAEIFPAISAFKFIMQPPAETQGIAWSVLLCEWALIIFSTIGLSQSWKKFTAGAFIAMLLGIALYFAATLLNVATPQETMSAAKPHTDETMKSDATKDGTYLFDEAAKIFVK